MSYVKTTKGIYLVDSATKVFVDEFGKVNVPDEDNANGLLLGIRKANGQNITLQLCNIAEPEDTNSFLAEMLDEGVLDISDYAFIYNKNMFATDEDEGIYVYVHDKKSRVSMLSKVLNFM